MKRLPKGTRVIHQDRLVIVWQLPSGERIAQGKRVRKDCPLTDDQRRLYVQTYGDAVAVVKQIRQDNEISLYEAKKLLDSARNYKP